MATSASAWQVGPPSPPEIVSTVSYQSLGTDDGGVAQRKGEQYLVLGAKKMMPIGDEEHFYISDMKGMESKQGMFYNYGEDA